MLKINRYIFFIILVFSFLSEDINEQSDFSFRNISVKDGLAESTVKEIFEDENGFIYIGTENGLDVFNGYEFKNYNMNSFDDLSILGNKVSCIYEDSENKIWVSNLISNGGHFNPHSYMNLESDPMNHLINEERYYKANYFTKKKKEN